MIRQYQPADIDYIVDIWLRASIRAHDFVPPEFWRGRVELMRSTYIPGSETWVYEQNRRICGFFSFSGDTLEALFVSPEHQDRGIGQQLINKAKSLHGRIVLYVYASNKRAIGFYASHGFRAVKNRIDSHTGHNETLMILG